jgi:hypothetical protein
VLHHQEQEPDRDTPLTEMAQQRLPHIEKQVIEPTIILET